LFIALLLLGTAVAVADGLTTLKSAHNVPETMDRFENAARDAGLTVFARIDHGEQAGNAGLGLRPTQLLIFGSPKVGTHLMQSTQRIGIDLPLKVLVWEDGEGKVWLGYLPVAILLQRYAIADRPKIQTKMTGLLAKLARAATMP
jgi:uncharacterized protein (DUF302 family)